MSARSLEHAALDCVDVLELLIDRLDFVSAVFGTDTLAILPSEAAISATIGAIANDLRKAHADLDAARKAFGGGE